MGEDRETVNSFTDQLGNTYDIEDKTARGEIEKIAGLPASLSIEDGKVCVTYAGDE